MRLSLVAILVVLASWVAGCTSSQHPVSVHPTAQQTVKATESEARAAEIEEPNPTSTLETIEGPSAPHIDGRILIVKEGSIWRWKSGTLQRLTRGERFEGPAWSPDGQRIAAVLMGDNHSDLVLLDESGTVVDQLTRHWSSVSIASSTWARHPAWSPDGSALAYCSDATTSDLAIWLVDAKGESSRMLVPPLGNGGLDWPSWSPDGKYIAFSAFVHPTSQVFVMDLATGLVERLTDQADGAHSPAWSPDGSRIAYVGRKGSKSDIWVIGVDGTNPVRLTETGASVAPTWSPDGQYIAYLTLFGNSFDLEAARLEINGQRSVRLAEAWRLTNEAHLEAPAGVSWAR